MIISVRFALFVVFATIGILYFPGCRTQKTFSSASEIALPKIKINAKDGAEMTLIPSGVFLMGTSEIELTAWLRTHPDDKHLWFTGQMPQRTVELDAYYIYKTEVTVAQYRKFCTEMKRSMPPKPAWGWQDNFPIVNVSWDDAKAYANWAGVMLPTEAQWEKAARGKLGQVFPWGDAWDASKARCSQMKFGDAKCPAPVGSFPKGSSPYGVLDMTGNVWEWCADWSEAGASYATAPTINPHGPRTGINHAIRGGSWFGFEPRLFRTTYRNGAPPRTRIDNLGFRCASKL